MENKKSTHAQRRYRKAQFGYNSASSKNTLSGTARSNRRNYLPSSFTSEVDLGSATLKLYKCIGGKRTLVKTLDVRALDNKAYRRERRLPTLNGVKISETADGQYISVISLFNQNLARNRHGYISICFLDTTTFKRGRSMMVEGPISRGGLSLGPISKWTYSSGPGDGFWYFNHTGVSGSGEAVRKQTRIGRNGRFYVSTNTLGGNQTKSKKRRRF